MPSDKPRLLVVDDDEAIRTQMKWALSEEYDVLLAGDRPEAIEQVRRHGVSLVALDLGLPPAPRTAEEGLRALDDLLGLAPAAKVVVITGNQDKRNAVRAIEQGAYDFFTKPVDLGEVKTVLRRAALRGTLERDAPGDHERPAGQGYEEILGTSSGMRRVFATIRKVARTDAPVFITGESGTGKELVARAIHRASERRAGPFVAINCGAIPDNLLESELFGHEKGAFTGAESRRKGRIEHAVGGTLFLDEVGELSMPLQVKLLRFLQERQIERVGGHEPIEVDVRVLAATNRDVKAELAARRFREDLYYRLGVVTVCLPPLRDREEDLLLLARAFLQRYVAQYGRKIAGFSAEGLAAMRAHTWPGNVRELENRIRGAVILTEGKSITGADLELAGPVAAGRPVLLRDVREQAEQDHLRKALLRCGWNISQAAVELGVSRPTVHDLIKRYRLSREAT